MNDVNVSALPLPPGVAKPAQIAGPAEIVSPAKETNPVAFSGERGEFRRLVVRGSILELITLGFYRFWLATDMRRHLWSHTSVGGDAMEYTGTAKELLIGFLFALAILVPVNLAYFLIGIEAELVQVFASVPLFLFFYLFYQFAIYRARRYRLTRTVWRGVRFWMTGSGWSYAWRASLWTLAVMFSGGLALPWSQAALERFKMKHSFYGDLQGRFEGTADALFEKVWPLWAAALLSSVAVVLVAQHSLPVSGVVALLALVASPFMYAIYKALEWRWWVSGIRFGDVRFESKLPAWALVGLTWKVIGWSVLLLSVLIAWLIGVVYLAAIIGGAKTVSGEAVAATLQKPLVLVVMAVGYIACAQAFGVVIRMYLRRDVWAQVAASSMIHNLTAADNVIARGEIAGSLGEGLADGLGGGL